MIKIRSSLSHCERINRLQLHPPDKYNLSSEELPRTETLDHSVASFAQLVFQVAKSSSTQ